MKSKISFFNKTIYFKNITLYWPIWGLYQLCLLLSGPAMLWLCLRQEAIDPSSYPKGAQLEAISACTYMPWLIIVSIIMALITAMALFNYLSVSKSANMIHALPVSRMELFGTNLLSGMTFLFVPQIITFMLDVLICLAYGATGVEYFAIWLLVSMGVSFFFFSIAVFCTFLTGQMFSVPLYYFGIIFLYDIIRVAVGMVVDFIGYGLDFYSMFEYMNATWLSPAHHLWDELYWDTSFIEVPNQGFVYCDKLTLNGGITVALYLIPAVILLVLSYFLYQKRHIETAGDLITVPWLKPVFRWGIGFFAGYFMGVCVCAVLKEFYIEVSTVGLFIAVLLVGVIFFFISEMCIQKNFRVFKKRTLIESGCFAAFMLITFLAINISINAIEHYIPEKGEVDYVEIDLSYPLPIEMDDEEAEVVFALHQEIIDHLEEYKKMSSEMYVDGYWLSIDYVMKNGDTVQRRYYAPYTDEIKTLIEQLRDFEKQPKYYLTYTFGKGYENAAITEAYLEYYTGEDDSYEGLELSQADAQKLYEAAIQDAWDENLQKYNDTYYYYYDFEEEVEYEEKVEEDSEEYEIYDLYLNLGLYNSGEVGKTSSYNGWAYEYYEETSYTNYVCLTIGKECKNLIQALIDIGFIESEADLANYPR